MRFGLVVWGLILFLILFSVRILVIVGVDLGFFGFVFLKEGLGSVDKSRFFEF